LAFNASEYASNAKKFGKASAYQIKCYRIMKWPLDPMEQMAETHQSYPKPFLLMIRLTRLDLGSSRLVIMMNWSRKEQRLSNLKRIAPER
jgi:hypothetical protein